MVSCSSFRCGMHQLVGQSYTASIDDMGSRKTDNLCVSRRHNQPQFALVGSVEVMDWLLCLATQSRPVWHYPSALERHRTSSMYFKLCDGGSSGNRAYMQVICKRNSVITKLLLLLRIVRNSCPLLI